VYVVINQFCHKLSVVFCSDASSVRARRSDTRPRWRRWRRWSSYTRDLLWTGGTPTSGRRRRAGMERNSQVPSSVNYNTWAVSLFWAVLSLFNTLAAG